MMRRRPAREPSVALLSSSATGSTPIVPELRSASDDARAISSVPGRLGFDVIEGVDLDLHAIGEVRGTFEEKLESKPDVPLLFLTPMGRAGISLIFLDAYRGFKLLQASSADVGRSREPMGEVYSSCGGLP
jgi:hypothetical protein